MNDVIGSIGHAITLAKRLREISKNIEDAEFKNLLADLNLELADTKIALADVMEQNAQLRTELATIKHSRGGDSQEALTFKEFAYFTESNYGPFCSKCYETENKRIRLKKVTGAFTTFGHTRCPSCEQFYDGKI